MFGRKKEETKDIKKDNTKVQKNTNVPKKKHWILKTIIVLLVLGLFSYGAYIYVEHVKEKSYIQGGEDAIGILTQAVEKNGGAAIEFHGKAITVSAYYKPIGQEFITEEETTETTQVEDNSTET